jgi:hypothetical protein
MIHPLQMMELCQELYGKLEAAAQYIGSSRPKHRDMCLAHLRTAMRMVSQVPRDTQEMQDELYPALQDIHQVFLWMQDEAREDLEWVSGGRKENEAMQDAYTTMARLSAELFDCIDTVRDALGLVDNYVGVPEPPIHLEAR